MLPILFAPFTLLACSVVLFLVIVPVMLLDDRRRGTKWTKTQKALAALSGVLIVLFGGLVAYVYAIEHGTSQLTSVEIGTDVHLEATPSQVVAVLDSRHVEHTRCSVGSSKGCILTAVSRDRSSWHLIRADHVVEFRFDSSDRLVAKIAKDYLTGP